MNAFGRQPRSKRRKIDRAAWLATDHDFALRPCRVVDISDQGAKLDVAKSERLPRQFNLTFSRSTRRGLRCEIRWKEGRSVGVKFVPNPVHDLPN